MNKFKDDLSDIYKGNKKIRLTKNDKILLSLFKKEITKNIQNGGEPDNVSYGTKAYNTFKEVGKSIYNVGKAGLKWILTPRQKYEREINIEIVSKHLEKYISHIMTANIVYDDKCRKMINKFIDKATEDVFYRKITKITILVQAIIELIYDLNRIRGEIYIENSNDIKSLYDNLCIIRNKIVDRLDNLPPTITDDNLKTQISEEFTGYYHEIKKIVQDNIINEQDFKFIDVDGKKEIPNTEKPLLNMFIDNYQIFCTINDDYMSDINKQINYPNNPNYKSGIINWSISKETYESSYKSISMNFYRDKHMNDIQQEMLEIAKNKSIFDFDKENSIITEKFNEVISKQEQDYDSTLKTLFAYIIKESDTQYETICKIINDSSRPNSKLFIWNAAYNQLRYNLVVIIKILNFINWKLNEIDVSKLSKEIIKQLLEYIIWINYTSIIYNPPQSSNNQTIYQILKKFVIFRVHEQISKDLKDKYGSVKNNLIDPYESMGNKIDDMEKLLNKATRFNISIGEVLKYRQDISELEKDRSKYQKDYDIYDNLSTFLAGSKERATSMPLSKS